MRAHHSIRNVPLLDWSQKQLNQYRERLSDTNLDGVREAKKFLSPYLFPLQIEGVLPEVEKLLNAGLFDRRSASLGWWEGWHQ